MERKKVKHQAFTLLEVMVVLFIVAIITAVAVLNFGDFGETRRYRIQIDTLKQALVAARQEAILASAVIGMSFDHNGYRFYRYWYNIKTNRSSWRPLQNDALSRPNAFDEGTTLTINNLHDYRHKDTMTGNPPPAIVFLPSGFVTAFNLIVRFPQQKSYRLVVNHAGKVDDAKI